MIGVESGTVVIVDDDVSVREALQDLLAVSGWETRTFESARSFLAAHATEGPCCLILDIGLPDLNGLDVQSALSGKSDAIPIIFITGNADVPTSVRAMKAGALEFLMKPFSESALLEAVRRALEQSRLELQERLALASIRGRYDTLTPREREVMALVVTGLLNKQIAHELGISEVTVKLHRGRVMGKTNVRSVADLVRLSGKLALSTTN